MGIKPNECLEDLCGSSIDRHETGKKSDNSV